MGKIILFIYTVGLAIIGLSFAKYTTTPIGTVSNANASKPYISFAVHVSEVSGACRKFSRIFFNEEYEPGECAPCKQSVKCITMTVYNNKTTPSCENMTDIVEKECGCYRVECERNVGNASNAASVFLVLISLHKIILKYILKD